MPVFCAQSFVFAVFATLICQINSVFPCKDTKAAKSVAFCDSLPVFLARSFGGQRLSSRPSRRRVEGSCIGFWKSKANSTFCKVVKQKGETFWHRKSHFLCNCLVPKPENSAKPNSRTVCRFPVLPTPCAKAAKSYAFCVIRLVPNSWDCYAGFFVAQSFGLAAFKKAGKFYFCKSSQTSRERRAFASGNSCFISSRVQKLQNSAFAEFWDCMPVSCFTNALCQNPRIRRSRILGLFAGFHLGMRFRL